MSNLGSYQRIVEWSKRVGGPNNLLVGTFIAGGVAALAVKSMIDHLKREKQISERNAAVDMTYVVHQDGTSENGVILHKNDRFRVLGQDREAVIIEILDESNNPHVVTADFLKGVSDF